MGEFLGGWFCGKIEGWVDSLMGRSVDIGGSVG